MTTHTQAMLDAARKLPESERAQLACELIATLDGEADVDCEGQWATEVELRATRAISGQSTGRDWPSVLATIRQGINPK